MASDVDKIMVGDVVSGIIERTVKPNFCQEFATISYSYEEKVRQVLSDFFAYWDDYITSTGSKIDYATSAPDQEQMSKVSLEAIFFS